MRRLRLPLLTSLAVLAVAPAAASAGVFPGDPVDGPNPDIVALGDFNLPEFSSDDPIYRTLTSRGVELLAHKSAVGGSSLDGHRHYDQVAFFPGETSEFTDRVDVFDFDNAVFADLFAERLLDRFLGYVRYHLSDHRPLWAQFSI